MYHGCLDRKRRGRSGYMDRRSLRQSARCTGSTRSPRVDAEFLGHALKSLPSLIQFKGSEYGGTKQGLGLDEVKNVEVLLPNRAEQRAIVLSLIHI